MNVLILGGRSFVALELVRNFGSNGHIVYTAESARCHPSAWSKYSRRNFRVKSPRFETEEFIETINRIVTECSIDLVLPTCEETFYVSHSAPQLVARHPGLIVACGDYSSVRLLHDKLLFARLSSDLAIPTPRTLLVRSNEDLQRSRREIGDRTVVLKPRFSRFGSEVNYIKPTDDFRVSAFSHEWVCQEYVEGYLLCYYAYASKGSVLVSVLYKSPFVDQSGVLTAFMPTHNKTAKNYAEMIIRNLSYSGSISFDLIVGKDGVQIIECNPRSTSGVHCLRKNDFASIIGGRAGGVAPDKSQIRLANVIKYRHWLNFPDAVFRLGDPLPVLSYLGLIAELFINAKKHRISMIQATTYDIEWNGDDM